MVDLNDSCKDIRYILSRVSNLTYDVTGIFTQLKGLCNSNNLHN